MLSIQKPSRGEEPRDGSVSEANALLCNSDAIQEEHPLQMSGTRSSARKSEVALIVRLALTFRLGIVRSDDLA
jgi:hypothetical protein